MKKIIVIGCPGSGKSTFSKALHKETGIPLYHLDMMNWNADKTIVSKEVFTERLQNVLSEETWIIDGNYGSTMELRLKLCDTVFFLDYPADICLDGVQKRKGTKRSDMPWIETEDDEEFLEFIRNYNTQSRPKVLELLKKYNEKNIVIFKSRKDADDYLSKMQIKIEPIKPEEYSLCSNIWDMSKQPDAGKWLEEIKTGNRLTFIYKINDEFIGEGSLVFDTGDPDYTIPGKRVYVSRMIVKKEYRNRGIGSAILTFLIEKATDMGFEEMTIGVDKDNVNALHIYKKFGFTEVLFDGADEHGEYFKLMKRI